MHLRTFFGGHKVRALHSGVEYTRRVAEKLATLRYKGHAFEIGKIATADDGTDMPTTWNGITVNWETKNKHAFEAGGRKLKLVDGKLTVHEEGVIKSLLADTPVFDGKVPSFMLGPIESWSAEDAATFRDQRIQISPDAGAQYYAKKGDHYIIVEGRGVYHTGTDILEFGVPKFVCETTLRIRTSKHRKKRPDGTRVPTDVVVDINYNYRTLPESPIDILTRFPAE